MEEWRDLCVKDKYIIRNLAKKVAEIASDPINNQKRYMWMATESAGARTVVDTHSRYWLEYLGGTHPF